MVETDIDWWRFEKNNTRINLEINLVIYWEIFQEMHDGIHAEKSN